MASSKQENDPLPESTKEEEEEDESSEDAEGSDEDQSTQDENGSRRGSMNSASAESSSQKDSGAAGSGMGTSETGEGVQSPSAGSSPGPQHQPPQQPLFSIPADVVRQLRIGTPLIKVGTKGRPMRRHFRVSPNYKWLEWIPSRKASEFVDLDEVQYLRQGMHGDAWEKYKANPKFRETARELHWHHRNRKTERLSGWLNKKGGAKGGWAVWTKRWFTLTGAQLVYYKSPENPEEKGRIPLEGCEVKDNGDLGFTLEFGPLRPTRELKAEFQEDKDAWMKMIREASAARVRTVVRRSNGIQDEVPEERLSFSIVGKDNGRDVQLLCASLSEFEIWYGGLLLLIAARKKKLEPAEQLFDLCLKNDPEDAFAHVGKGRVAWKRGDYDTAIEWMTTATNKAPDLKGPYVSLADVYTAKGSHAEAVKALREAYKLAETDERVLLKLSRAMLRDNRGEEAMPFLQKLLSSDPYNPDAHCALGEALVAQGQIDAAEAHFAAALQSNSKFVYAYINLGVAQEKRGDLDTAIDHYKNAVDIAPSLKSPHLNLATCYARRKQDDKDHELAAHHYKKIIELDPKTVRPYLGATYELHVLKKVDEAWEVLSQAIDKFGDVADVHAAVGHFYQRVWVDEAPEEAVNSEFVDPNSEDNHCDELWSAIDCYSKAIEIDETHFESLLHLGSVYRRLGRFEKATETLRSAQSIIDQMFNTSEAAENDENLNKLADDINEELKRAERLYKQHGAQASEVAAHEEKATGRGKAESVPSHTRDRSSDGEESEENSNISRRRSTMPYSVPAGVFQAFDRSQLSSNERSKKFFQEMKKQKEQEKEEEQKKEERKKNMMTEEEKAQWEREREEQEKHSKKKDKMLKGQLTVYSASQRSGLGAGRGRGRGAKAKEKKEGE